MIGIGGATRFAILKTDSSRKKRSIVFMHSLAMGGFVALVFVIISVFYTTPLSRILGADEITLPLTRVYLSIILGFSPFFVMNNILLAFIRNDNNPKLAMAAMLISSFSNIILDYIFMFPLSLGILGAAVATGLSPIISLCVLSVHFIQKKQGFHFCKFQIHTSEIVDIVSLGLSSFIGELASAISLITFNLVVLRIAGNIGVAAYGIIANIALIATAVFTGVAQGIQPLASEYFGKKDTDSITAVLRFAMITCSVLAVLMYAVVFISSVPIVAIFNSEGNNMLADIANSGLRIYFTGYFFAGMNIVLIAFLSAISHSKPAMLLSVLRSCVFLVPLVIWLSMIFSMEGVWFSFVSTEVLVFLISVFEWFRLKKV